VNRTDRIFLLGGIPSRVTRLYRFGVIDESAIRLFAAVEAKTAGPGGVSAVMRATAIARSTIGHGPAELRAGGSAGPVAVASR
jgi:hypothetical protein